MSESFKALPSFDPYFFFPEMLGVGFIHNYKRLHADIEL
jgi:hypothetical protein